MNEVTSSKMPIPGERFFLKNVLRKARTMPHSRSNLAAHLIGTARVLDHLGAPQSTVKAALIHSIYSTQFFETAVISMKKREEVVACVGDTVETLAYLFSVLNRVALWDAVNLAYLPPTFQAGLHQTTQTLEVTSSTLAALAEIEIANHLDQLEGDRHTPTPWMAWALKNLKLLESGSGRLYSVHGKVLSGDDEAKAAALYREMVRRDRVDLTQAQELVEMNPLSAECHTLLTIAYCERNMWDDAKRTNIKGLANLDMWGCTWDRRLHFAQCRSTLRSSLRLLDQSNEDDWYRTGNMLRSVFCFPAW